MIRKDYMMKKKFLGFIAGAITVSTLITACASGGGCRT